MGTLQIERAETNPVSGRPNSQNRRMLIRTGFFVGTALLIPGIVDAQSLCPPLSTDGNPAECTTVGNDYDLVARSRFSRYYFVDSNKNGIYDHDDRDIMGVPNARLLIETLKPLGSSDFVQPDFNSRTLVNGIVHYYDQKNRIMRPVQSSVILRVPEDGGIGLAVDAQGNDTLNWYLRSGDTVDKVWGPVSPHAGIKNEAESCKADIACDWNCVQWVLISRLMANSDSIHQLNGKVSSIIDFVYYWNKKNQSPVTDHSYINSPVVPGSDTWLKEELTEKYVERPVFIRPYAA